MEDFQESEILWPDHHHHHHHHKDSYNNEESKTTKKKNLTNTSHPVSIPVNLTGNSWFNQPDSDEIDNLEEEQEEEEKKEMVPPHVMVGQRINGGMAFSVCTGNGRTLKGRDLSRVRNSILRMTGFLETC